jgi:hypothetical protein
MSKSTTSPSFTPARPTPQVFMIVIASTRAVSVETSKSSLGQDTMASCAWVRVRIASAMASASASAAGVQISARS